MDKDEGIEQHSLSDPCQKAQCHWSGDFSKLF